MAKLNKLQFSFVAGIISPRVYGRIDLPQYMTSLRTCRNFNISPFGAAIRRSGTAYITSLVDQTKKGRMIPFIYSDTQAFEIEVCNTTMRFYQNQGIILAGGGGIYSITSPYSDTDIPQLTYTQSFDSMYFAHPNYPPYKLVRVTDNNWTLTQVTFAEPAWADINTSAVTVTPSAVTGSSVTMTASTSIFASTDVGRYIRLGNTITASENEQYPGTGSQQYFTIPFFPNDYTNVVVYLISADGSQAAMTYNASPSNNSEYSVSNGQVYLYATASTAQRILITPANVGSGQWGYAHITAYTSGTAVTATIINTLSGSNATTNWRLSAWGGTTGYPSVCAIYDQRLWFGNSSAFPSTIWGSNVGSFENFQPDDPTLSGTVIASSAIVATVNTPAIKWMKGLKVLIAGGSDGVFEITSSQGGGVSPLNIFIQKDMNTNCSSIIPCTTSDQIIFVENLQKKIYATKYYFQYAGFFPNEITKYYDNIASTSTIAEICYAESPGRQIWVRTTDGRLFSCTYLLEDQTTGWSEHVLGGTDATVESISVIPGENYSELWMIVNRTINGSTTRYVEVLQEEYNNTGQSLSFFVDSGAIYNSTSTSTITGLDYLEGQTVSVLGNGAAQNNKVVSSGSITLDVPVTYAVVGLPYVSDLESPYIEGGCTIGTSQTAISRVHRIGIRFDQTLGGSFGYDSTALETIIFNNTSDTMDSAPALVSQDIEQEFNGEEHKNYKVWVRQTQPYPMSILCLIYKATVADV